MNLVHLTFSMSPLGRRTRACVRRAVASLARLPGIVAFHLSDTHLHLLVEVSEPWRVIARLRLLLPMLDLGRATVTAMQDEHHPGRAFEYILRNDERHGIVADPWRENSNLPDLLGLRVVHAATIPRVRAHLPRVDAAALRAMADWPALVPGQHPQELLRAELGDAMCAALAVASLSSRSARAADARAAAVQIAAGAGWSRASIGDIVGLPETSVRRLLERPVPAAIALALERQLALRAVRPLPAPDRAFDPNEPPRREWKQLPKVLRPR